MGDKGKVEKGLPLRLFSQVKALEHKVLSLNKTSVRVPQDRVGLAHCTQRTRGFQSSRLAPWLGFFFFLPNKSRAPNDTLILIDQLKRLVSSELLKTSWKRTFKVVFLKKEKRNK